MPESNDDKDSEVNYKDPVEPTPENQPLILPPGYITNNPEHPFYYRIYVRNPAYRANQGDWTQERLIVAPFIKYSTDYTHVTGSAGRGLETRSCPVLIDRRVPTHHPMTALKWKHLRNGSEREFGINMALAQMNDPKFHGEINCYRGLSGLHDTLEKLMRDAQGRVMEVMKELIVVDGQLELCKKRLEISNAYEELDRYFRQAMPIPLRPRHSPIQSPLVEAPRVVRAVMPLPSRARGAVEMPILHSDDPDRRRVVQCFRCKKVGHVVSQCPRKKKMYRKCPTCGGTHKIAKCPVKSETTPSEVATREASEDAGGERMTLLECIALLDHIKYLPTHCSKCGRQNPEHLEMECLMYEQCISCYQWGPRDFIRHRSCSVASDGSWGANTDYYKEEWYQGRD